MTEKYVNGIKIYHYDNLPSTNKAAIGQSDAEHLLTLVADMQSGGRGRMGRSYFSYDGGLYMSVVLDPSEISVPIRLCTPAAALAVFDTLTSLGVDGLKIKWVNDIYKDGKKVCGILTEACSEGGGIKRIIVGIGINLAKPKQGFPAEIAHKAADLDICCDKLETASSIAVRLGQLIKTTGEYIIERYSANMLYIGENATVTDYADGNRQIFGKIIGVDADGGLIFGEADGYSRKLTSGEIIC